MKPVTTRGFVVALMPGFLSDPPGRVRLGIEACVTEEEIARLAAPGHIASADLVVMRRVDVEAIVAAACVDTGGIDSWYVAAGQEVAPFVATSDPAEHARACLAVMREAEVREEGRREAFAECARLLRPRIEHYPGLLDLFNLMTKRSEKP